MNNELDIEQSVEEILAAKQSLGESFYEVFFNEYPEVQTYFEGLDMRHQGVVLTMALQVIAQYYARPVPALHRYLQVLGSRHRIREIPRHLYDNWTNAMLISLEIFHGDQWNRRLAAQRREAIERATRSMFEGYDQHFSV